MSNKINPEITIVFDKPRHLRYDINAMATFEELTGLNLMKPSVIEQLEKDMSISQFRSFLYACLVHEDKNLTLKQVGSFINPANMGDILTKIGEAQKAATPEAKEGEETSPLEKKKSPRR